MVQDTKHHATDNGEGQKKTDGSDKQAAAWTFDDALAQQRTEARAAKQVKQCCRGGQKNRQENQVKVQTHEAFHLHSDDGFNSSRERT
jgi:hypothetical protein